MAEIQGSKGSPSLDMTPMVDLAFLLVTFFMLTAQFKPQEIVAVDTPSAKTTKEIPKEDLMLVTIDSAGRVFWTVDNEELRGSVLDQVSASTKTPFTVEQRKKFTKEGMIGVPLNILGTYLEKEGPQKKLISDESKGTPYDSLNNELREWISAVRTVHLAMKNDQEELIKMGQVLPRGEKKIKEMKWGIKGDGEAPYEVVQKIIKVFQDPSLMISRFSLVTDLEEFK